MNFRRINQIIPILQRRITISQNVIDIDKNNRFIISNFDKSKKSLDDSPSLKYINQKFFNSSLNSLENSYGENKELIVNLNSPVDPSHNFLFGFNNLESTIGNVTKFFKKSKIENFYIDPLLSPYKAGLFASLAWYDYSDYNLKSNKLPKILPYLDWISEKKDEINEKFTNGLNDGLFQNFARFLSECPSNILTPENFHEMIIDRAESLNLSNKLDIKFHNKEWCDQNGMIGLQAVGKGSQKYGMIEVSYSGNKKNPNDIIVLIGKGVTFDSGGISIKPSQAMFLMKGDMGGAAVASASTLYAAYSNLKMNLKTFIPVVENSPDGNAIMPGSVITYPNGKKVEIINTDAEGRLVLADALLLAKEIKPKLIVDLATLTGAITISLADKYTGCFSNKIAMIKNLNDLYKGDCTETNLSISADSMSEEIHSLANHESIVGHLLRSSTYTQDYLWPMPLYGFHDNIKGSDVADIVNAVENRGQGGSSEAAVFLHNFVDDNTPWIHLDIASVFHYSKPHPVYGKGMTGRPTGCLNNFLRTIVKKTNN